MRASEAGTTLAETLLAETREELVRADGKASLLLAADGVIVGAVVTGIVSTAVSPLDLQPAVQWMFWVGVIGWIAGIVAFGVAVWPTVGKTSPGRLDYFRDVLQHEKAEDLVSALEVILETSFARTARQLHILSRIVERKYRAIRSGMALTAVGTVLCLLAWTLDAVV